MAVAPPIPETAPVGIRVDATGRLRVGNSRVMVEMILGLFRGGESAEALLADFPSMDAADLYATIAFYLRNKAVMDAWVDQCERDVEEILKQIDEDPRSRPVNEKFKKLYEEHMAASDPAAR